jgi:dolichol-phosphate mannosyltransferase
MVNGKVIVVVIPCYNVENQIDSAIRGLPEFVDHIIVIDDSSKDKTHITVNNISNPKITLLRNDINLGVGGAMVVGFRKGLELGGDIFIKYDGDGQMDPTKMIDLINPLFNGFDYAKGNRFLHSDELDLMPKIRLIGNFFLTFFTKLASGYWKIFDPQNGYIAIKRDFLEKMSLDQLYKRYFFENDMLVNLNILKAKVIDVSMPAIYSNEKSSLKVSQILLTFPFLLLNRFIHRIYKKYVLHDFSVIGFFYFLGLFLKFFGVLFGAYHWALSVYTSIPATTGTVMISVLPIILGFQIFLQAMVLEINDNNYDI